MTEWRDPEDREGLESFRDVLLALRLHSGGATYDVGYWTGAYWRSHLHKDVIAWAMFDRHKEDRRKTK